MSAGEASRLHRRFCAVLPAQQESDLDQTPVMYGESVSSATGLYLPGIMKDFPGFHLEEMKSRALRSSKGAKTCAYCDSPVVELNFKAWNFTDVKRVEK